jgi:hypothetical protein
MTLHFEMRSVDIQQIVYALQRAERQLEAQAAKLGTALNYDAEFFAEDAERMREAAALLEGLRQLQAGLRIIYVP